MSSESKMNKCSICNQILLFPDSIKQGLCTYHSDPMITNSIVHPRRKTNVF